MGKKDKKRKERPEHQERKQIDAKTNEEEEVNFVCDKYIKKKQFFMY